MRNPLLRPLFFGAPGPDSDHLNAGSPADDVRLHATRLGQAAMTVAWLRGVHDPSAHMASDARAAES
jgi:hypothetical protein